MTLRIKRVYEDADPSDGLRVLVDRLWPRGLTKERADVDEWVKDAGPSAELRSWFGHDPSRFEEFAARYRAELSSNPAVEVLRQLISAHDTVTLLYGAKNEKANQAVVLREYLA